MAVVALGCQEEIRRYEVPKSTSATAESPRDEKSKVRLLAVMAPHGDRTWFFKLLGPARVVDEHKDEFDEFIRSVHFTKNDDQPVTWKAPADWRQENAPTQKAAIVQRHATFQIGPKDGPAELTVIALGAQAGSLQANVNRWRGQIGLRPVSETELSLVSHPVTVDGDPGTLVDMTAYGAAKPGMGMTPGMVPGATPPPVSRTPLTYTVPGGWKELPGGGMRVAAFAVPDGPRPAEVTIVPLGGPAGGLLGNVNRWREQINLPPVSEEQLRKELSEIDVDGTRSQYADLTGPGAAPDRILAVIIPRGDRTWFVKMKGPSDLVARQKPAFEAFVRSIRFTGGTGANHG